MTKGRITKRSTEARLAVFFKWNDYWFGLGDFARYPAGARSRLTCFTGLLYRNAEPGEPLSTADGI